MAGARYTDRDRAIVFAELSVNEGNVKRTARNTGIPVATVRRWRNDWAHEGVPEVVVEAGQQFVGEFLPDAVRIRGKLLEALEAILDRGEKATIPQLTTGIGILSDKIRAYEAIAETQKVEHKIMLPPAEELQELFSGLLTGVVEAAKTRAAAIEALEEPITTTTYRELPEGREEQ